MTLWTLVFGHFFLLLLLIDFFRSDGRIADLLYSVDMNGEGIPNPRRAKVVSANSAPWAQTTRRVPL
jgi:hypothetical protein